MKELVVEEARKRGVKVRLLLLDKAFFTVECINLLRGSDWSSSCPASATNERVQGAVDSFGREGRFPFSIHGSSKNEAPFTMVVYWSKEKGKLVPFLRHEHRGQREKARRDDTERVQEEVGHPSRPPSGR